jgi:hypothetical protein
VSKVIRNIPQRKDIYMSINVITETQRLDAKNPDNPEDSSSARISRRAQPDRSQEIKKERCEKIDQTGKYFPKRGGRRQKKPEQKDIQLPIFNLKFISTYELMRFLKYNILLY